MPHRHMPVFVGGVLFDALALRWRLNKRAFDLDGTAGREAEHFILVFREIGGDHRLNSSKAASVTDFEERQVF